jgi:hypothetical protein
MKAIKTLTILFCLLCSASCLQASLADVESTVQMARARLGEEQALKSVQAIRYHGKVTLFQPEQRTGEVILTFQKPCSQKIEFVLEDRRMVTAFNGYEGYELVEGVVEGQTRSNIRSVGGDELRRNKAAAIENLNFFRPFPYDAASVVDHGMKDIDGKTLHHIDFIHNDRFVFSRYFDKNSGVLLRSDLDTGMITRESGELIASGIRFSQLVKGELDGAQQYELEFDRIEVNPVIEADCFDYPSR